MNRKAAIAAARKLLAKQLHKEQLDVWINVCGNNPPPTGYQGKLLNIGIHFPTINLKKEIKK